MLLVASTGDMRRPDGSYGSYADFTFDLLWTSVRCKIVLQLKAPSDVISARINPISINFPFSV